MFTENNEIENQTKFGLLGLLDVIRMTNADLNTLALGSDLTTLGLNLNSSECLYSTFASPWAEAPTMREPQFSLPMCYYMQPPPLKTSPRGGPEGPRLDPALHPPPAQAPDGLSRQR